MTFYVLVVTKIKQNQPHPPQKKVRVKNIQLTWIAKYFESGRGKIEEKKTHSGEGVLEHFILRKKSTHTHTHTKTTNKSDTTGEHLSVKWLGVGRLFYKLNNE